MRDQEIIGLSEAYASIYASQEEVEQLDEAQEARNNPDEYERGQRGRQSSRERRMNDPHTGINSPAFHAFMARQTGGKKKKKVEEETDLFDYILEYLVAEGFADTNENAVAIMANMSDEWRQSIVEGETVGGGQYDPKTGKIKDITYPASKAKLGGAPGVMWRPSSSDPNAPVGRVYFRRDPNVKHDSLTTWKSDDFGRTYKPLGPGV